MKTKHILLAILCFGMFSTAEAQLLNKLKKKAEQAVLSKKEEANNDKSKNLSETTSGNSALEKHTEAKKAFYKEDVIIKVHENGKLNQTQYFDADQVTVRIEQDTQPKAGYLDSEGFIYGYNDREGIYNKSSMVALGGQGMMMPTMLIEGYKLPPEPFMANLQKQQDQDLTPNPFNGIVEFAFIYEPEHFRYEDFNESKQSIKGNSFTKFEFLNEPGYEGSYVLFDDQDRLIEIYTNKTSSPQSSDEFQMDMMPPGVSLMRFEYKPVDVNLPSAKVVKEQGQDMMNMVYGSFKKDKSTEGVDEDDYDTSDSKGQVKSARTALKNNKVTAEMLPESYDFDWKYEAEMVMESKKKEIIDMTFLIKKGATYQGMKVREQKSKDKGDMTMLFDLELNTMLMFMESQGHKILQIFPIPEPRKSSDQQEFNITQLPAKTILNYNCNGLQIEDDKYIIKVYHTTEAPVELSNFMGFSGNKSLDLPELDPKIVKQFSDGLIMEMHMIDKKKSKNNVIITAKSLKASPTSLHKNEYQNMNFLSGGQKLKGN